MPLHAADGSTAALPYVPAGHEVQPAQRYQSHVPTTLDYAKMQYFPLAHHTHTATLASQAHSPLAPATEYNPIPHVPLQLDDVKPIMLPY